MGNLGKIFFITRSSVKFYNKSSISYCSFRTHNYQSLNMETSHSSKTDAVKRSLDSDETNEKWVKRIQLDPVLVEDNPTYIEYIRRKLRKFVLLLSYCGKGYLGMQRNPGTKTIEDELLGALLKASLIKEDGVACPQIYRFQRAARTDKGVSAARQIVSVKLPDDVDIPEEINKHLPKEIRVMKAVRVTQKFDAKLQCDARTYSYLTPTFAFAPVEEKTNESYRISTEGLEQLKDILSLYKGTHNFHNFTARVKYSDRSAKRYIMEISCSEPFVRDGLEWLIIKVKGQSFMLHQIRKMIGLAMAISRGFASESMFDQVWKDQKCDIPIAPGLGLVLEEPHYDYYNKKYNDGIHELLLWDNVGHDIQSFREKYIDAEIIQTEINEKVTLKWLETLSLHSFHYQSSSPTEQQSEEEGSNGIAKAYKNLKNNQQQSNLEVIATKTTGEDGNSQCNTEDAEIINHKESQSTSLNATDSAKLGTS